MADHSAGWKLDSGLRESMDLTVHSAYFGTSQDYQNGNVFLLFLIGSDEAGEPVDVRMSVGADWTSTDGGVTIVHPTKRLVNKNSILGHFVNAALALDDRVNGQTLRDTLFSRGDATDSRVWVGLMMHLDLVEIKFGRNIDPMERLLPTRFLGIYDDSAPPVPGAAPVAPAAPAQLPTTPLAVAPPPAPPAPSAVPPMPAPPVPVGPPPVPPATVPVAAALTPQEAVAQARAAASQQNVTSNGSPLFQEMLELARVSGTHGEFMAAAFARSDVLADEDLAIQIADENSQLWALAKS